MSWEYLMNHIRHAASILALILVVLISGPSYAQAPPPPPPPTLPPPPPVPPPVVTTTVSKSDSSRAFANFFTQTTCNVKWSDVGVYQTTQRVVRTTATGTTVERTRQFLIYVRVNEYDSCKNTQLVSAWGEASPDKTSEISLEGGRVTALVDLVDAMNGNKTSTPVDVTWVPSDEFVSGIKIEDYYKSKTMDAQASSIQQNRSMRATGSIVHLQQYGGEDESAAISQSDAKGTTTSSGIGYF
jgi:hypothetical protein